MEQKKVTYTGVDTEDVTEQLEQGNAKLAEKGWREYRVDMLSSSAVRVTYVRGELEEDEELPWTERKNKPLRRVPSAPEKGGRYGHRTDRRHCVYRGGALLPAPE